MKFLYNPPKSFDVILDLVLVVKGQNKKQLFIG